MDEKLIVKNEQEKPVVGKKAYAPPALTAYGKLTDLTAGGSRAGTETGNNDKIPLPTPPART